jgi:hypothetical protein
MIHVVCDCCKRIIDLDEEVRYIVRMEVFAAVDVETPETEDDRDYLQEIEELLDRDGDVDESLLSSDVYEQARFDLCADCRQKFVRDPLGRSATARLDFSDN